MALVPDQKFSTFAVGGDLEAGDIVVGLRGGLNTQFSWTGDLPPGVVVPISQGGTGATTAAAARTNLGLGTMAVQNANAVAITGGTAALTSLTLTNPLAGAYGGTGIANTGLTINLGSATTGYVLTSDSSGNATWQAVSADGAITTIDGDSGSATPLAGVLTISGSVTGLTFSGASHTLSLAGVLNGAHGGTGHANTGLTINLGSGASGDVLTSDSSGNGTWAAPGYLTGAVLLSPSGNQTITSNNLTLANGILQSTSGLIYAGSLTAGGNDGSFIANASGGSGNGQLAFQITSVTITNGATLLLTNDACTTSRTWKLPDISGVLAVTGQGGLSSFVVSGTTQTGASGFRYICTNVSLTTISLPSIASSNVGDVMAIVQAPAAWVLTCGAGQSIRMLNVLGTISAASTGSGNCIELCCIANDLIGVTATWEVTSAVTNYLNVT